MHEYALQLWWFLHERSIGACVGYGKGDVALILAALHTSQQKVGAWGSRFGIREGQRSRKSLRGNKSGEMQREMGAGWHLPRSFVRGSLRHFCRVWTHNNHCDPKDVDATDILAQVGREGPTSKD